MKQEYFVVVLAHSLRGRLRRIHIPHQAVYVILALALLGCFSVFGFVASYARMAWKVANYNALKREADALRARYQNLQNTVKQTNEELASLQLLAKEVQVAYGIKQKIEGPATISSEGKLIPTFAESLEDYKYLRYAAALGLSGRSAHRLQPLNAKPSSWPVDGRLMGGFGTRQDPFAAEESEFHTGVDISAPTGTPVRATADGVVLYSDFRSGYGRLIVVDHGGGIETYYAHLSRSYVQPGQEVRRGDLVGLVGATGRVTAPHLHYEVRKGGVPTNPYLYLAKANVNQPAAKQDFPF
ncbi:MAG TPA: M23 family metallopeptidase [Bryobacteraceae bacterium]|jgi:murein DD-endopeptidase MepM/ murein hydrolase activator NlpD